MKKKEILIYDDDPGAVALWKKKLEDQDKIGSFYNIATIEKDDFAKAISGLEYRRREARRGINPEPIWDNRFDQVHILVIDYDLFNANNLSGEEIAYLVRCYSRCGLIIALNQFDKGYAAYDLTLEDHPESFADLNIGDPLLDNMGLWFEPWEGFRPWAWPLLPSAFEQFDRKIRKLMDNLDKPILEYLGFPQKIARILPRSILEFLSKIDNPMEITFNDFVTKSGSGLRGKDKPYCEEGLVRIAAAKISHWLEYLVLPGQNILVDAPHLNFAFSEFAR